MFNRDARIELHNIHATPLLLLQELSAFGTVPFVWKSRRIGNSNTTIVEPLVLAVRIIALNHVVRQFLLAYAVLNWVLGIRGPMVGIGLTVWIVFLKWLKLCD